ncbi:uncharacterized protein LOC115760028 [Drosophila novamexicana]|uniref:uncharacterized protein LOC115760028 n=1 Tax=Drosophila novamexicana TaxID=47314 RepID=UPI0011E5D2B6|nr:uncharacterized protein LOC115760028 [Drosophila novamexicana]
MGEQQQIELQFQQQQELPCEQQQSVKLVDTGEARAEEPPLMVISAVYSLKPAKRPLTIKQLIAKKLKERHHRVIARIEISDSESENEEEAAPRANIDKNLPLATAGCDLRKSGQIIELP